MRTANLPETLKHAPFCPACGALSARSETIDPYALCFSCSDGHRFFVMPEPPPASRTRRAASGDFPEMPAHDPLSIATFWLTDSLARSLLNQQLAELLRVVVESRVRTSPMILAFCPICGDALTAHDQRDIWVLGLKCARRHAWAERGGKLHGQGEYRRFILHAEPDEMAVRRHVAAWLGGSPDLDAELHRSVREALAASVFAPDAT